MLHHPVTVKPRLHDYNRFVNRLYSCKQTSNRCQTGLTTGWMFVYTIQPVVKPGCTTGLTTVLNEQPLFLQPVLKPGCTSGLTNTVWQSCWTNTLFVQSVVKPGCTPGLTTGCIHDTAVCQTGCQTGLTTSWMFVYTIQPVVKTVWQQVVSCKRGFTNTISVPFCI